MKSKTLRTLMIIAIILDLALLGLIWYDYDQNQSDLFVPLMIAFAVLIAIIALIIAFAKLEGGGKVVERIVEVRRSESKDLDFQAIQVAKVTKAPAPPPPPAGPSLRVQPPKGLDFPFVYNGYTLYTLDVDLKNGGRRTIYFFSKRQPKSGRLSGKPGGYHVGVNKRTGLPFLKRGAGADGENLTPHQEKGYRPQCSALTDDGKQCRNSAREGSKYCGSHIGYQPSASKGLAKRIEGESWSPKDKLTNKQSAKNADTRPKVRKAKDTRVSVRKTAKKAKQAGRKKAK